MRFGIETPDFTGITEQQVLRVAAALRGSVEAGARFGQEQVRARIRATGIRGAGNIANAVRRRPYGGRRTFAPTEYLYTRTPEILKNLEEATPIVARRGKWLAFPTGFNAIGGRRNAGSRAGLRVTPAQMVAAKGQAFVIPTGTPGVRLWCLRVREARSVGNSKGRGRNRLQLFVAGAVQVGTGRVRGQQARARALLEQGFVPMFVLARQVTPTKRLTLDDVPAAITRVVAGAWEQLMRGEG